jgi:hypothetical protein
LSLIKGHTNVYICLINQEFNKRQLGSQNQTPIRFDLSTIKISFFRFKFGFNNTKMISTPWTLVCTLTIVWYFFRSSIKPSMEGGGKVVRSEKCKKTRKRGSPWFSDNSKYPPPKNLAKTPRTTPTHSGFPTTVHLLHSSTFYLYPELKPSTVMTLSCNLIGRCQATRKKYKLSRVKAVEQRKLG